MEKIRTAREMLEKEGSLEAVEVSEKLKIAINSIFSDEPKWLSLSDEEVRKLLKKHPGVQEILEETPEKEIAWAIHLATQRRSRSS